MKRSFLSASGVLLLGIALILINGIAAVAMHGWSVDLTKDKVYSLSDGSKRVLSSLQQPITLKYFFSKKASARYPILQSIGVRVRELLMEYQRNSGGKLKVEEYDPEPDTEEEEWAGRYGISSLPVEQGLSIYFGLVGINALGKEESIPLFQLDREQYYEYDITQLLFSISREKKPVIGILSNIKFAGAVTSLNPGAPRENSWFFYNQLKSLAEVKTVDAKAQKIADDINLLMVIHPQQLTESTLYAIDQFVMRGGNLFVAVDPFCQSCSTPDSPDFQAQMFADKSSSLNRLLEKWGLKVEDKNAIGDIGLAAQVTQSREQAGSDFPLWLQVRNISPQLNVLAKSKEEAGPEKAENKKSDEKGDEKKSDEKKYNEENSSFERDLLLKFAGNLNSNDVALRGLEQLLFPWVGAVRLLKTEGVEQEPLIISSARANLVDDGQYSPLGGDPESFRKTFMPGNNRFALAARASGKFKSNFPDGAPKAAGEAGDSKKDGESKDGESKQSESKNESKDQSPSLKESSTSSAIVVVADVDFLGNRFSVRTQDFLGQPIYQLLNDNLAFIQNTAENLLGSNDLISLRSRGSGIRPFTRVQERERRAQEIFRGEEQRFQAELNGANERLAQLEGAGGSQKVVNQAVMEEVKNLRRRKQEAQRELRIVRRKLREDIEQLGRLLFFLNTFAVPFVLVVAAGWIFSQKRS